MGTAMHIHQESTYPSSGALHRAPRLFITAGTRRYNRRLYCAAACADQEGQPWTACTLMFPFFGDLK